MFGKLKMEKLLGNPFVVSIVGRKKSGKTTFLKELISEFVKRGYRVGTVKHDVHGFEIDVPGKDTWIHREAGASTVAISSSERFALIKEVDSEITLEEVFSKFFDAVDIVFTEGFKREKYPKVEIMRKDVSLKPLSDKDSLLAVVSDEPVDFSVPCFGFEEVSEVADLIEKKMKEKKGSIAHSVGGEEVEVWIDGKQLRLKPFVKSFIYRSITGMLSSLRGGKGKKIKIHIGVRS